MQNFATASAAAHYKAPQDITGAIQKASLRTGVDFSYLMNQAKAESSFKADAKASTSSATGLYQFIESTWLNMVKNHGEKYGLADEASHIQTNANGRLQVSSPSKRSAILDLRKDPELASAMAAELASSNQSYLENNVKGGAEIGATELYFAHFLGARGASNFLNQMHETPYAQAADYFPKAAAANRNVFYDRTTGAPKTFQDIHAHFSKKFDTEFHAEPAGKEMNIATAQNQQNIRSISPLFVQNGNGSLASFLNISEQIEDQNMQMLKAMLAFNAPERSKENSAKAFANFNQDAQAPRSPFGNAGLPLLGTQFSNPLDILEATQTNTNIGA